MRAQLDGKGQFWMMYVAIAVVVVSVLVLVAPKGASFQQAANTTTTPYYHQYLLLPITAVGAILLGVAIGFIMRWWQDD